MRGESSDISALRVVRNNTTVYDWSFIQQCPSSCEINCLALVHIWRMFQLPCSSIKDSIIFDTQRVPNAYINYITAVISTVCKRRSCRVILTPTTVPGSHGSIIIPFHCWKLNLTFPAIKKTYPKLPSICFMRLAVQTGYEGRMLLRLSESSIVLLWNGTRKPCSWWNYWNQGFLLLEMSLEETSFIRPENVMSTEMHSAGVWVSSLRHWIPSIALTISSSEFGIPWPAHDFYYAYPKFSWCHHIVRHIKIFFKSRSSNGVSELLKREV